VSKIVFGYDKIREDGDPIDNCIKYDFNGWKICDTEEIILGMVQKVRHDYLVKSERQWVDLFVDTKLINEIETNYIYVINVREFTAAIGMERFTGKSYSKSVFDFISEDVLLDCQKNKCKILMNYGFEGFGKKVNDGDTILNEILLERLHFLLDQHGIPQQNFIYMDSNNILDTIKLDTKINYFSFEYCGLDWYRYTTMHPSMNYHGNTYSRRKMKEWQKTKEKIRKKYFISFNRLPKTHRLNLVLFLESKKFLEKGFVSFPKYDEFWNWNLTEENKFHSSIESLKEKLPLEIDKVDLQEKKWSFELFNNNFYLDSYFQIVTENQCTSFEDQLSFTEKVWKPITNLQPFILLADRHQIKQLKKWGFKTFHPFIDESYDDILDKNKRQDMIFKQIEKLCNKPIGEIHDWYWSIEPILKHNYYHFYGKWIKSQRDKLLDRLDAN
tara:strand:+ start:1121 stop:2446 length:1326 start_codon:yes stop_codon:yes gene_type:complete